MRGRRCKKDRFRPEKYSIWEKGVTFFHGKNNKNAEIYKLQEFGDKSISDARREDFNKDDTKYQIYINTHEI